MLTYDDSVAADSDVATHEGTRFERAVIDAPQVVRDLYVRYGCPLPQ